MGKIKTYVLDTNILLDDPNSLYGFEDNNVLITGTTLQELDSKKSLSGELGFNARQTCRLLESLRQQGDLTKGVSLENGGKIFIEPNMIDETNLPSGYSLQLADNRIISSCISLKNKLKAKSNVILVTNDVSMRINASVCGLEVQSYHNSQIKPIEPYLGRVQIEITDPMFINDLYANKALYVEEISDDLKHIDLEENEFLILTCGNQSALAIHQNGMIKNIQKKNVFGVTPKNASQVFALYALTAPVEEIPIVILKGPAGCAKTFLSLAGGLDACYSNYFSHSKTKFDELLITRNNSMIPGEDFGFLPGDILEKMTPLLAPFKDNLKALLRNNQKEDPEQIQMQIEDMFESKMLDVCPIAYMRGRSISNSYLIVDECQNTTKSQMRDIITRIGQGSKLVLCGDPDQIDNIYLDRFTNGLTFASERMKGSKYCAQITFTDEESVRSPLATDALKRLVI